MNPSSGLFRTFAGVGCFSLLAAATWSACLGHADRLRQTGLDGASRAARLDPFNAQVYRAKALYEELAGVDPRLSWQKAAELDPREPRLLIPAGIQFELRGDLRTAEYYFREAERHNKLWLPRWTLANYYARRGDLTQTLVWLRAALERSYGEDTAAFQLATDLGASPQVIAETLLPDSEHAHGQFLNFFTRGAAIEGPLLAKVAQRYISLTSQAGHPARENRPVFNAIERLMADGNGELARGLWDEACQRLVIPSGASSTELPVVNARFAHPILGRGLDWVLPNNAGISAIQHPGTGTIKFHFTGAQEGLVQLLHQQVVLPAGRSWHLSFEFLMTDIQERQAAFAWLLDDEKLPLAGPFRGDEWSINRFSIPAAPTARVSRLSLIVEPPVAAARPSGELWIRNVKVAP